MIEFDPMTAVESALAAKSEQEKAEEATWQQAQRTRMKIPTALEIDVLLGQRIADSAKKALQQSDDDIHYTKMADGLALQGKWHEALLITRDPFKKQEYQTIVAAVTDNKTCGCPEKTRVNNINVPTKFLKKEIVYDGKSVKLYYCTVCDTLQC